MIGLISHALLFVFGLLLLIAGVELLRITRKMQRMPIEPTYGHGVNKHLIRSGVGVRHGMVIDQNGNLHAQSSRCDI